MIKGNVFRSFLSGLVEYLLHLPIILLFGIGLVDPSLLAIWLLFIPILFLIGLLLKEFSSFKSYYFYSGLAMLIGFTSSFFFYHLFWLGLLLGVVHSIVVYRGMMYAGKMWHQLFSVAYLWTGGLGIYFVAYMIYRYYERLSPYLTLVTILGITVIIITLFLSNSKHLQAATLSKESHPYVSPTIKKQNQLFLIITFICILLITNAGIIKTTLWNGFVGLVSGFINLVSGNESPPASDERPPALDMDIGLPNDEAVEPSVFAKIMDTLMTYVMYVVIVIAVITFALFFIKKARAWIKLALSKLLHFLKQILVRTDKSEETMEYIDEKESIFDWKEWRHEQQKRAKHLVTSMMKIAPRFEALSNQQKVRYIYRQLIQRQMKLHHFQFKQAHTPRQTIEHLKTLKEFDERKLDKLAKGYERIRYGNQELNNKQINEFATLLKEKR
ncbi:hypothetical protein [Halalkalibacter urbisdiaboli]|uniref:hypothetical protein n=1 Tax=Halalkalibacter urbisdiaboli TaxID=1960589 RepID=UPI000B43B235|nr:hypothetical protein [Halalkalibacter urbisdiaboli]